VIYTVGIDSGSTATKGILLADGVVTRRFLCPTPFRPADAIHEAWETLRAGLAETPFLTLTGYGRQLVDFADKQVTEISCHGLGARLLAPETRTVIDIGGQDSKVIQLDAGGNLSDFLMNDKCAAGTGRFLEVMARSLDTQMEMLGPLSATSSADVRISSTCTVFAESEVVALVAKGVPKEDIIRGLHRSVAERVYAMVARLRAEPPFVMTGGVAKNSGVVAALEQRLGTRILLPEEPQIMGALGAAIIAARGS